MMVDEERAPATVPLCMDAWMRVCGGAKVHRIEIDR